MVKIFVKDVVNTASTNNDGLKLYNVMKAALEEEKMIEVSFANIDYVTTSFINSSIARLLSDYSFDNIKKTVKVTNANSVITGVIKRIMEFESSKKADNVA